MVVVGRTRTLAITAVVLLALVMGAGGAAQSARAQSADPGQVAYGNEIAALLRAGDVDGILARMSTTTENCPDEESLFFRACEGHWGETAEGYWVGQLGSDAVFVDIDGVRARIDAALSQQFTDSAFELFTVSPTGWQPGSFTCAECFTVVLSTEFEASAPNEPLTRSSTAIVFEVLNEGGLQRIRSVAAGGAGGHLRALLTGGMVGEQQFILVRARAQSADPGQVAYGNEIAALLRAGDIDGILARMSPTTVNCPEGETPQIWPVCEEHAGESAEGYWAAVFASDAVLTTLDNVGAHIESYLRQLSVSPAFELFTVSPTGWETGPTACAECFTFVLSTEADANRTSNGRPAPIAIMFQALRDGGAARIRSVVFGSASDPRGALLTGGMVGEQQFILVRDQGEAPQPPVVGSGLARGDGGVDAPWMAIAVLVVGAAFSAAANRWRPGRTRA